MRTIEIVNYRTVWPEEFVKIARRLRNAKITNILRIDHIGSTSVVGLSAKNVIDIQVTVKELSNSAHLEAFKKEGYRIKEHANTDILIGIEKNSSELRKQFFCEPEGERRTHIHVREIGRLNQRYPLLFRDYLKSDPIVRDSYEVIKQLLAETYPNDIDGYLSVKDPVMDLIYAGSLHWADLTEWQPSNDYH